MSSVGSFGTFTTARLAIYVANKGLSVTGNNIANINTPGYTRQRLDQVSFKTGKSDHYQSRFDTHVGNGAIPQAVSQLRDPYLDIRYRTEHSSEGFYNGKLEGLQDIKAFLDETGKGDKDGDGLLYAEFRNFFDALKHIEVGAGTEVNDTLALNSGDALCALFQSAADQLVTLKTNTESRLRQEVDDINDILTSIRGLNVSIRQAEIHGDGALELRDQRNLLIDDLSEKIKIDVTYTMEDIGLDREVEKLSIRLGNANPDDDVKSDSSLLVDGGYCAQLTTPLANEKYVPLYDTTSEEYKKALEDLKNGPITAPDGTKYNDQTALDAAIATMEKTTTCRYLDENGEPTNDPRDAKQVFDEHYNITVSDLRDKNYKAWEDYGKPKVTTPSKAEQEKFPTRGKYAGEIKYTGTWKNGDVIDVDGTKIIIGTDLSADAANNEPKNVANAIRDAMVKSDIYRDNTTKEMLCNISTTTTKNPDGSVTIALNISTKEAGDGKKVPEPPEITVEAANFEASAGNASLGTMTGTDPEFKFPVTSAEDGKWNKGDIITITDPTDANVYAKLEVGKDISVNGAKNASQLASAIARKMNLQGYKASTDKDNLVLTAAAGATTPPAIKLTVTPPTKITSQGAGDNLVDVNNDTFTDGITPQPAINLNPEDEVIDNLDNTTSRMHTYYTIDDNDVWHKVTMEIRDSKTKVLDDNDMFGRLQAVREQLTEEGEFSSPDDILMDESASIKRGIPYYQQTLDLLARKFAETMNEANTGFAVDEKGNYLTSTDNGKTFTKIELAGAPLNKNELTDDQKDIIEPDALGNFVRANFGGFVKNADGTDSNVLADKYGNPLKLGSLKLTTENVTINGQTLEQLNFKGVNEDGNLVDDADQVIGTDITDPNNPVVPSDFAEPGKVPDSAKAELSEKTVDSYLEVTNGYKLGGNLFSNRGDTDDAFGITASNISVAHSWSEGNIHVVPTYIKLFEGDISNTTQQDNALHMSNLIDRDLVYNPQDLVEDALSTHLFSGSFQDMFVRMNTTLGNDMHSTQITLETHAGRALDIDTSRDSVSAVDLNDEAMGLMQYSHSLNAAYRLMTTLDDMLERLITGTGVTR